MQEIDQTTGATQAEPPAGRRRRGKGRPGKAEASVGRERILEATAAFLHEHPLSELSAASLARAADFDPALVHYYFGSKDRLLTELIILETGKRTAEGLHFLSDTGDIEQRFRRRVRALLEADATRPYLLELLGSRIFTKNDAAAQAVLEVLASRGVTLAGKLIEDGQLRRVDPAFLHMLILGACSFFVTGGRSLVSVMKQQKVTGRTLDEFAEFLVDVLLNGLRPRPEDATRSAAGSDPA